MVKKEVKKELEIPQQEEPELGIDEVEGLFKDLESLEN
jgi:hypothetical protein